MRRPLFIARQAGFPHGLLGRAIAAIMVRESAGDNRAAIDALHLRQADHVLDIGCGSGLSIELLAPLVPNGTVSAVDPSPLMAQRARVRNFHLVERSHAIIATASVEHLPFIDETFDAIMSVHTIYFWEDLSRSFDEIVRVLREGGRVVLAFRTAANTAAINNFPSEVYRMRTLSEVANALCKAGLTVLDVTPDGSDGAPAMLVATKPGEAP